MGSSGKPKTTWSKLQREAGLRERRAEKAARKQIRKQAQLDPSEPVESDTEASEDLEDAEGLEGASESELSPSASL